MKITLYNFIRRTYQFLTVLMLVVLVSGMIITSFHDHQCTSDTDNCAVCRIQHTFSSVTIESNTNSYVIQKPVSEFSITVNDQATDPSQKIVCSSHAPPQYS